MQKLKKQPDTFNFKLLTRLAPQGGVTLMLTLVILSNVLLIASAVGIFSLNQFKITASARDSAYAIFAGTTGIEKALYEIRKNGDCTSYSGVDYILVPPDLKYSVSIISPSCGISPTTITSIGTYRQTIRKIEASW